MTQTEFLTPGKFVDSDDPGVVAFAEKAVAGIRGEKARGIALYHAVRDGISYNPYLDYAKPEVYRASEVLKEVLAELNYRNLDEQPEFEGRNTTTEFLAKTVYERIAARLLAGAFGESARAMHSLRVSLHESHVAWAAYEAPLIDNASGG